MKRRAFIFILCACLLFCTFAAPEAEAAGSVCFIAVNDNLLQLSSMPYFSGGVTYVPYRVFTDYGFNIYYSYFPETSTAMLYNSSRQIFFDLNNGTTYDGQDNTYSSKAVMRNGTVYVPATFVCNFFGGLACSYISGGDYGDIVRVKDSNFALSDIAFLRAASELMQNRYDAYVAAEESSTGAVSTEPAVTESKDGVSVRLSFIGLPDEKILTALRRYNCSACFFLTVDDVLSSPELVRRLDCDGYMLGVLCRQDAAGDYEAVSALIYDAAMVKTVMVTALDTDVPGCIQMAQEKELVYWSYDIDGMSTSTMTVSLSAITSALDGRIGDSSLFLSCNEGTDSFISPLMRYMYDAHLDVRSPRETDVWSRGQ